MSDWWGDKSKVTCPVPTYSKWLGYTLSPRTSQVFFTDQR